MLRMLEILENLLCIASAILARCAGPAGSGVLDSGIPREGEGGARSKRALRSFAKASFYFNACPIRRHRRLKAPQARPFGPRSLRLQDIRGHPTG